MTVEKIENYQKAKAFLDDAKLLLEHQGFNSAISRAYYALYQFSIYILAQYGETRRDDKWSHHGIQKALKEKVIIIQDCRLSDMIADAYQLRVVSDYRSDSADADRVESTIIRLGAVIGGV